MWRKSHYKLSLQKKSNYLTNIVDLLSGKAFSLQKENKKFFLDLKAIIFCIFYVTHLSLIATFYRDGMRRIACAKHFHTFSLIILVKIIRDNHYISYKIILKRLRKIFLKANIFRLFTKKIYKHRLILINKRYINNFVFRPDTNSWYNRNFMKLIIIESIKVELVVYANNVYITIANHLTKRNSLYIN